VLRKLVANLASKSTMTTNGLIEWAADLYIRQFDNACEAFRDNLHQLLDYPHLQAHIDTRLRAAFESLFMNAGVKAKTDIVTVFRIRESSLKLDMPLNFVRLLGCSQIPDIPFTRLIESSAQPGTVSLVSALLPKVGVIDGFYSSLQKHNLEFLMKPVCSVEDFAMCDSMETLNMKGREDVEKALVDINRMAQGFTKVRIGLNALETIDVMENHFALPAQDLERHMARAAQEALIELLDNNSYKLNSLLHKDSAGHAKRLLSCANELREWIDVATALNGVAHGTQLAAIANVAKVQRTSIKIDTESQKAKAHVEQPMPHADGKEDTSDDDDETPAAFASSSFPNFDTPTYHCIHPGRERQLLDQIATLQAQLRGQDSGEMERLRIMLREKDKKIAELEVLAAF